MNYPIYEPATVKFGPRGTERHLVMSKLTQRSPWRVLAQVEHEGAALTIADALNAQGVKVL